MALEKGYFKSQVVPVEVKTRKGTVLFDTDEHPRADASLDKMAKLRTAYDKSAAGTLTAANSTPLANRPHRDGKRSATQIPASASVALSQRC